MLHIRLFDHLSLWFAERRLPPSGRREVDRLLAYLVLKPGDPIGRAQVAEALWPGLDPSRALGSLRPALSRLQSYLCDHATLAPGQAPWLLVDRSSVGWNTAAPFRVDALEFEARCATLLDAPGRGGEADGQGDPIPAIEATLRQYGGPLLRDFGDDWVIASRLRLESAWLALQAHLAVLLAQSGQHERAVEAATQAMAAADDPLWELGHRTLMQVYALAGNRIKALDQFERCREALHGDLGSAPSPDTSRLAEAIRLGELTHDRSSSGGAVAGGASLGGRLRPAGARPGLDVPVANSPLIGPWRVNEVVSRLEGARLLTLTGPIGAGKSRVAAAAAARLAADLAGGVRWLDLAALGRSVSLAAGLAEALDLPAAGAGAIAARLGRSPSLLVLDNVEGRVAECAALVAELLAADPAPRILVTAHEPLALHDERVWQVPLLGFPDRAPAASDALAAEATALFGHRAARYGRPVGQDALARAAVETICRRLDGLPWAIELAAACTRGQSLADIAARVEANPLALLDEAGPGLVGPRHCSFTAALESSFARLDPAAQALLARVAAFRGPFSVRQAEVLAAGDWGGGIDLPAATVLDGLDRLVAGAWIAVDINAAAAARHRLLGVIRHFGLRKLGGGELAAAFRHQDEALGIDNALDGRGHDVQRDHDRPHPDHHPRPNQGAGGARAGQWGW